ncbi:hypothetical protein Unana1_08921 [Umbelopsis nana]
MKETRSTRFKHLHEELKQQVEGVQSAEDVTFALCKKHHISGQILILNGQTCQGSNYHGSSLSAPSDKFYGKTTAAA